MRTKNPNKFLAQIENNSHEDREVKRSNYLQSGQLFMVNREYKKSIKSFKKALELSENDKEKIEAVGNLLNLYLIMGKLEKGIELSYELLNLEASTWETINNKGRALTGFLQMLIRYNKYDDTSMFICIKMIEKMPDYPYSFEIMGKIFHKKKKYKFAKKYYERFLSRYSNSKYFNESRAKKAQKALDEINQKLVKK